MDNRTAPAMRALADAVSADLAEITEGLGAELARIRALESWAGPLNGLAATLRARGNELEQAIRVLGEEAETVRKKLLPSTRPEITERVNVLRAESAREVS